MCLAVCSTPGRRCNIHLNYLEYFCSTFKSNTALLKHNVREYYYTIISMFTYKLYIFRISSTCVFLEGSKNQVFVYFTFEVREEVHSALTCF